MTWLTWRQSRMELMIGGVVLALVALFLLLTRLDMTSYYNDAGLPACEGQAEVDQSCMEAANAFLGEFRTLDNLTGWLNLLPFVLGLLLAAPTVLDLEHGTHRLAWTQSVTRRRWLAMKIGFGLAVAVGVAVALTALWTWWRRPFDSIEGRFNGSSFDYEGSVTIGYLVFAFALSLALGTLLRRTIASIGIGLVLFLVTRVGIMEYLRPHYLEPKKLTWELADPPPEAALGPFGNGDWVFSHRLIDAAGNELGPNIANSSAAACGNPAQSTSRQMVEECLSDQGIMSMMSYHPADRFWTFQAIETAIFLGLAAGLLGLTVWWVTRRIV